MENKGSNDIDLSKYMKNLTIPDFNLSYQRGSSNETMEDSRNALTEAIAQKEQYNEDRLHTLKKIEGNTANLTILLKLIQSSNDKQGEIIEIVSELLALAKEEDKEVIESRYRKIMNKIPCLIKDVNTIETLTSLATSVLHILTT
ncbi:hypothetical protein [Clostridium sp.]|uniref:hypothetical protein n=1 Tax=Clostridium sp. TaxID=1506 RepID=UPI003A26FC74